MRFEYSPEKSSSLTGGSSPLFVTARVGTASSSLTPGSSIASVAGKKRLPATSCAAAPARDASTSASAGTAEPAKRIDMGLLRELYASLDVNGDGRETAATLLRPLRRPSGQLTKMTRPKDQVTTAR